MKISIVFTWVMLVLTIANALYDSYYGYANYTIHGFTIMIILKKVCSKELDRIEITVGDFKKENKVC